MKIWIVFIGAFLTSALVLVILLVTLDGNSGRTSTTSTASDENSVVALTPTLTKTTSSRTTTVSAPPSVGIRGEIAKILLTGITVGIVGAALKFLLDDSLKQREETRERTQKAIDAAQEAERVKAASLIEQQQARIEGIRGTLGYLEQSCRAAMRILRSDDYIVGWEFYQLFEGRRRNLDYEDLLDEWEAFEEIPEGEDGTSRKGPVADARATFAKISRTFTRLESNVEYRKELVEEISNWAFYYHRRRIKEDPYDYEAISPPSDWVKVLNLRTPNRSLDEPWAPGLYVKAAAYPSEEELRGLQLTSSGDDRRLEAEDKEASERILEAEEQPDRSRIIEAKIPPDPSRQLESEEASQPSNQ